MRGLGKDMDQLLGIDRFRQTREGSLGRRRPDSTEQITGYENDGQLRPYQVTLAKKIEAVTVSCRYCSAQKFIPVISMNMTARAIEKTGPVTLLDPDHHLFTLQDDREVNMVLFINKGRGFVTAEQHAIPKGLPVDLVRVDAIYNPVLRANFAVEETRVGQRTDFDRLTLLVETNGSVSPEEAVAYSAELARKHLEYMLRFGAGAEAQPPVPGAVKVPTPLRDLFRRPIEDLAELSVRSVNSLKKENIITLGDLVQRTEEQMLGIENFGIKSLEEIRQFLNEHSLHFGMKLEEGEDGEMYLVDEEHGPAEAAEVADAAEEDAE